MISAARRSLESLADSPAFAKRIQASTSTYREQLRGNGFNIYGSGTQIVPIACESDDQAFAFTKRCRELGLYVIPIVYPAVPMNAPRIRTNLTMLHTDDDIRLAIEMLTNAGRETGVIY
jgi:7-keto-8-aminopelargonate synthetase-like enzyme